MHAYIILEQENMNSFNTLFFPETDVFNEKYYPLLLLFTPLHFLQLVEHGPGPVTNSDAELFLRRGLCQAHVPAPLGENREQFLRLIHDLGERDESSVVQLSGLTIDSTAAPAGRKPRGSKHRVVSSLLQEYGVNYANTEENLKLWQARLVLALAEILDSNEEALQEQLFFFNEDEIAAFRSLQNDDDSIEEDIFSDLENIKARLEKSRFGGITKRFDAWLRLLQNQPVPPVKILLASTRDSADQIFNRYESIGNAHAVPLLKLALPAQIAASGTFMVEQIEEFQHATMSIHQGLVADFERIARTVPYVHDVHKSLLPYGTDWADQWKRAMDDFFPASINGRNSVTFYLLPDQQIDRLLSLQQLSDNIHGDGAHGLLAILDTQQIL